MGDDLHFKKNNLPPHIKIKEVGKYEVYHSDSAVPELMAIYAGFVNDKPVECINLFVMGNGSNSVTVADKCEFASIVKQALIDRGKKFWVG